MAGLLWQLLPWATFHSRQSTGAWHVITTCCLQLNKTITILRLTYNNIPDEGICALAEALNNREDNVITEIDISGNKLQARGARALSHLLEKRGCILKSVGVVKGSMEDGCLPASKLVMLSSNQSSTS